jgi:hypothetical protein
MTLNTDNQEIISKIVFLTELSSGMYPKWVNNESVRPFVYE